MQFSADRLKSVGHWLAPLLIFFLAAFVYSLYGFQERMFIDNAMIMYSGQRMAEGIPPYVGIFYNKAPLSPMLVGGGSSFLRYGVGMTNHPRTDWRAE